jgi:murein endopeptidase
MVVSGSVGAVAGFLALLHAADATATTAQHERCSDEHAIKVPRFPKWIRHKVVPRESVDQIAFRYDVAPWQLRWWNGLQKETERVKRGTRLRVKAARIPPPREKIEYTVVKGDSWPKIAAALGVDSWDLRSYNWPYRKKMRPGTVLTAWVDPIVHDWITDGSAPASEPKEVPRGAVAVGTPDEGWLVNAVRIPDGRSYRLRYPATSYGTTHAVRQVVKAFEIFGETTSYRGTVPLGSMSSIKGGPLGHHKSHQSGRDLDIRLPRRVGVPGYLTLTARRIDWAAAWDLVKALAQTDIVVVFLDYKRQKHLHRAAVAAGASPEELRLIQYPRGAWSGVGLVRHYTGHDKHMHARFGCGPCETECTTLVDAEPGAP